MSIYQPAEDSYLLQDTLKKYLSENLRNSNINKAINILDMGSGSGIQAETCKNLGFNNILTADINPEAVELLNSKNIKAIQSNLFSKIPNSNKFDLIIFNPPYLPQDNREPKDSQLAKKKKKKGYELIIRFLEQTKSHLSKDGVILLLFSSLSQPDIILKKAKELDYNYQKLNEKKLFFEQLFVYEFKLK